MEYEYKNDIIETHKKGLGASDATLLAKIDNLGKVPHSADERLAIIKGLYQKEDCFKTAAMQNGDDLENKIFEMLHSQDERWISNPYIESKRYSRKNCLLFCHIDFMLVDEQNKMVTFIECKATKFGIESSEDKYRCQLFVENELGKEYAKNLGRDWNFNLKICHYDTENYDGVFNPDLIALKTLRFGRHPFNIARAMNLVDDYLEAMTEYYRDDIDGDMLPDPIKEEVQAVTNFLMEIKEREAKVAAFKSRMFDFMVEKNIKSIKNDAFSITRVDATTATQFDSKAFAVDHKGLYKKYLKSNDKKGYAKITIK